MEKELQKRDGTNENERDDKGCREEERGMRGRVKERERKGMRVRAWKRN